MTAEDESGKTLRIIATAMGVILALVAILILKTDPIRSENEGRGQAIEQVKSFATFIETRPELAQPEPRSVVQMARSRFQESSPSAANDFSFTDQVSPLLAQLTEPKNREELSRLIREHGAEMLQYLNQTMTAKDLQRDQDWDGKIELLIMMGSEKKMDPQVKDDSLDLLSDQLLQARLDDSDLVRYHADDWFERYLKIETRSLKKQQAVDIFNEKVIQAINQIKIEAPPQNQ